MMNSGQRALLDPQFLQHRSEWLKIFSQWITEVDSRWYPSLVVESRHKRDFVVNQRAEQMSENLTQGLVVRLFDGVTLFEEATHDLSSESLKAATQRLELRIQTHQLKTRDNGKAVHYYQPPTWFERLQDPLESEILSQIPKDVNAQTWVHFGSSQQKILWAQENEAMVFVKEEFQRLKSLNIHLSEDHKAKNPDFIQVKMSLEKLDFIFIDKESCLSQTLLRNAIYYLLMKDGERGYYIQGGLGGQECVQATEKQIQEAYERLGKSLRAEKIKPGRYKVLMSPSITGVFAHEAFGHSQEGDTWARGRSKARELYESKEKVGNQLATIMNNPAIYRNGEENFSAWGSYYFDEEGWLARESCLVREGVLQAPMTHLSSAVKLSVPRTANGKRENWTHGIYTRQTNTYFTAGDKTLEELMSLIDEGYLATVAYGGMEDPKGMGIQVGMAYVEEIKNGKLTGRVFKGPNGGAIQMTGYVPDYLSSLIAKSKIEYHRDEVDESVHPWNEVGGCGKYHKESVVAGCGGPFMLVDQVLLS